MTRARILGIASGLLIVVAPGSRGQTPPAAAPPALVPPATPTQPAPVAAPVVIVPGADLLKLLQANPITAPFRFGIRPGARRMILSGRVGSKFAHDVAIRTAIAAGYPIDDELIIDTTENARAALRASALVPTSAPSADPLAYYQGASAPSPEPYAYPPPLFGRYEDRFAGFEPPLVSYPRWWPALSARRSADPLTPGPFYPYTTLGIDPFVPQAYPQATLVPPYIPGATGVVPGLGPDQQPEETQVELAVPAEASGKATVEMSIDPRGVVTLRGRAPSAAARDAIAREVSRTPGISEVVNELEIGGATGDRTARLAPIGPGEQPPPPPPPVPFVPDPTPQADPTPPADPKPAALEPGAGGVDGELGSKLVAAIGRKPALAGLAIKVASKDGVASLSGKVPSVYEAMLAFRAVQQTPGVRSVVDRLEFVVPDGEAPNPLLAKGRAEDVEPYLEAQVRRQVGDIAHVDRVRLDGDRLEVEGSVARRTDLPRAEAILRSMPVLRGIKVEPKLEPLVED